MQLKGRPAAPDYQLKSSGLNFFGFPTRSDTNPTNFTNFLSFSEVLRASPPIYYYDGEAVATSRRLVAPNSKIVRRGEAFWIKGNTYTDYYGPIKVGLLSSAGIDYGKKLNTSSIRVKNVTDPAKGATITATLSLASSEAPPGSVETPSPVSRPRRRHPGIIRSGDRGLVDPRPGDRKLAQVQVMSRLGDDLASEKLSLQTGAAIRQLVEFELCGTPALRLTETPKNPIAGSGKIRSRQGEVVLGTLGGGLTHRQVGPVVERVLAAVGDLRPPGDRWLDRGEEMGIGVPGLLIERPGAHRPVTRTRGEPMVRWINR